MKEEPKLVRSIEKRRSRLLDIHKNSSLLDYQSYVEKQMERSELRNPELINSDITSGNRKSQTISFERSRNVMSPKKLSPHININLQMIIKKRRSSARNFSKEGKELLFSVRNT